MMPGNIGFWLVLLILYRSIGPYLNQTNYCQKILCLQYVFLKKYRERNKYIWLIFLYDIKILHKNKYIHIELLSSTSKNKNNEHLILYDDVSFRRKEEIELFFHEVFILKQMNILQKIR